MIDVKKLERVKVERVTHSAALLDVPGHGVEWLQLSEVVTGADVLRAAMLDDREVDIHVEQWALEAIGWS